MCNQSHTFTIEDTDNKSMEPAHIGKLKVKLN